MKFKVGDRVILVAKWTRDKRDWLYMSQDCFGYTSGVVEKICGDDPCIAVRWDDDFWWYFEDMLDFDPKYKTKLATLL